MLGVSFDAISASLRASDRDRSSRAQPRAHSESTSGWASFSIVQLAGKNGRRRLLAHMRNLDRRRFVGAAASVVAAGKLGLLSTATRITTMTDVMAEVETSAQTGTIRPFHCQTSDLDLADLRKRIKATRWPDRELVADDSQGV